MKYKLIVYSNASEGEIVETYDSYEDAVKGMESCKSRRKAILDGSGVNENIKNHVRYLKWRIEEEK